MHKHSDNGSEFINNHLRRLGQWIERLPHRRDRLWPERVLRKLGLSVAKGMTLAILVAIAVILFFHLLKASDGSRNDIQMIGVDNFVVPLGIHFNRSFVFDCQKGFPVVPCFDDAD